MTSRRRCSDEGCGSRRFHVADDGFTYCDRGHQQSQLGTVVAEDTGELSIQGQTSRRRLSDADSISSRSKSRVMRKKKKKLILRKHVRWLIDARKMPEELEVLVRDMWALRLQCTRSRASHDSGTDTEAPSSQKFSSQSDGESESDGRSRKARSSRGSPNRPPSLSELLCVEYVAMMLLRAPVTITDVHGWITSGEVLYYQASKELPLSMRSRLPPTLQANLNPSTLASPDALHSGVLQLLERFSDEFGMVAPPLNHPLILHRWVKELCLPLEVHVATQRLSRILGLDFGYTLDRKSKSRILRYPEVRLMALLIIATKLTFPLDGVRRYPRTTNDLGALRMDWKAWEQVNSSQRDASSNHSRLSFEQAFDMDESSSLGLANDRLDDYLDWCEQNLACEEMREHQYREDGAFRTALFSMFPAGRADSGESTQVKVQSPEASHDEWLKGIQRTLQVERILLDDDDQIPRAGSAYIAIKVEADLQGSARAFYEKAANVVGLSLRDLTSAVYSLEGRLGKHELESRRHTETK